MIKVNNKNNYSNNWSWLEKFTSWY